MDGPAQVTGRDIREAPAEGVSGGITTFAGDLVVAEEGLEPPTRGL